MGLDIVELVMAVEEEFGISIPDAEAGELMTPRAVIHYVERHATTIASAACRSLRSFHLLRAKLVEREGATRSSVRLDTRISSLVTGETASQRFTALGRAIDAPRWPRLRWRARTVRDLMSYVRASPQLPWTRREIAERVRDLVVEQLGLRPSEYREGAHFIRDLGAG